LISPQDPNSNGKGSRLESALRGPMADVVFRLHVPVNLYQMWFSSVPEAVQERERGGL